jgi:hypothetical protein
MNILFTPKTPPTRLLLVASVFGIYAPALAQEKPLNELPLKVQHNPIERRIADKQKLLEDINSNNYERLHRALGLFRKGEYDLSEEAAIPLFIDLIQVTYPDSANPQHVDDFNLRLIDKLRNAGEKALPALPKMLAIAADKQRASSHRFQVFSGIASLNPTHPQLLTLTIDWLQEENFGYTKELIWGFRGLMRLGVDVSQSLPLLKSYLKNPDIDIAGNAFSIIGQIKYASLDGKHLNSEELLQNLKRFKKLSVEEAAYTLHLLSWKKVDLAQALPLLKKAYNAESDILIKERILNRFFVNGIDNNTEATRFLLEVAARSSSWQDTFFKTASQALKRINKEDTSQILFIVSALNPKQHKSLFSPAEQRLFSTDNVRIAIIDFLSHKSNTIGFVALPVAEILRDEIISGDPNERLVNVCLTFLELAGQAGSISAPVLLDLLDPATELPSSFKRPDKKLLNIISRFYISDNKYQKLAVLAAIEGLTLRTRV